MEFAQNLIQTFSGPLGYAIFFLIIFSCSWGMPFNSDFQIVTASVLASLGVFNLWILMLVAFTALIIGDSVTFFLGRKVGPKILVKRPLRWIIKPHHIDRAKSLFHRHGSKFLICIRFIPLVRPALFFTAGTLQLKPSHFYICNIIATSIYLPIVMNIAFYFAEQLNLK